MFIYLIGDRQCININILLQYIYEIIDKERSCIVVTTIMVNLDLADWSRGGVDNGILIRVPGIRDRMSVLFYALQTKIAAHISELNVFYKMDLKDDILYILYMHNVDYNISEPTYGLYICESYEMLKL